MEASDLFEIMKRCDLNASVLTQDQNDDVDDLFSELQEEESFCSEEGDPEMISLMDNRAYKQTIREKNHHIDDSLTEEPIYV